MLPESKLIKSEIVIREMSLPDDVLLAKKSLVRWIALSLGLILPNESRMLLLDVLDTLLYFHVKRENPTTQDILGKLETEAFDSSRSEGKGLRSPKALRQDSKPGTGNRKPPNPKAVYYHLLKLKESGILIRKKGRYMLSEEEGKPLPDLFREIYLRKANAAFVNVDTALKKLQDSYL